MIWIIAALQALAFYLVPLVIGRALWLVIERFTSQKTPPTYPAITYFTTGMLSTFGMALAVRYGLTPLIPGLAFHQAFFPVLTVLAALSALASALTFRPHHFKTVSSFTVLLCLALSIISYSIWLHRSPYPLNWDIYEHQALPNLINQGNYSFFTSQISDTFGFDGYPSIFHTLLAAAQHYGPLDPLAFWTVIGFFHLFLGTLASYVLAYQVTKKPVVAAFSALFGAFVFESALVFTSYFLIPQTFTAVMAMFLLAQLFSYYQTSDRYPPLAVVVISSVFLILNHYIMGALALGLYLTSYLFLRLEPKIWPFFQKYWLLKGVLVVLALIVIGLAIRYSYTLDLNSLNKGEGAAFIFDFPEKFNFMRRVYGYSLLLLLPLGLIRLLYKHTSLKFLVFLYVLGLLGLTNLYLPYMLKFYVFGRFFVHLVMAIGLGMLIESMSNLFSRYTAALVFGMAMSIILITNAAYWKNNLYYQDLLTHVSPQEVEAAEFLKQAFGQKNTFLISDPGTQYVLEALSGLNTPGGAYASEATRRSLDHLQETHTPEQAQAKLLEIKDALPSDPQVRLWVLSGRYFRWQRWEEKDKLSLDQNVWTPSNLTVEDRLFIEEMTASSRFEVVYENPTLVILKVSP